MPSLGSLLPLAAALAGTAVATVPSNWPTIFPNGLGVMNTGTKGGLNAIGSTGFTYTKWAWGTIPKPCYEAATNNGYCNVYDVEVYDLKTDDCSVMWQVCRCNNSPFPVANMMKRIAAVPIKARQYVRYWMFWPGGNSAYSNGYDLTFFGDFSNEATVFHHENSHNLDAWVAGSGSWYSDSAEWQSTINSDSCAPDSYAKSSNAEELAQVSVMVSYDQNVQAIGNIVNTNCLKNQYAKISGKLASNWKYVSGQTCNFRISQGNGGQPEWRVCMGPAARSSGACQGWNDFSKRSLEIEAREDANGTVTWLDISELPADAGAKAEAAKIKAEEEAGIRKKRRSIR